MYRMVTMFLNPDYDEKLRKLNTDLVCYVVEKSTTKVVFVSVVTRGALGDWYMAQRPKYDEVNYDLVIATNSIVGVLAGASVTESQEPTDDKSDTKYKARLKYGVN
jgi:hypothetical protein